MSDHALRFMRRHSYKIELRHLIALREALTLFPTKHTYELRFANDRTEKRENLDGLEADVFVNQISLTGLAIEGHKDEREEGSYVSTQLYRFNVELNDSQSPGWFLATVTALDKNVVDAFQSKIAVIERSMRTWYSPIVSNVIFSLLIFLFYVSSVAFISTDIFYKLSPDATVQTGYSVLVSSIILGFVSSGRVALLFPGFTINIGEAARRYSKITFIRNFVGVTVAGLLITALVRWLLFGRP